MCDQGNARYSEVQELSLDWEDRFLQMQRQIETTLNEVSRSGQKNFENRGSLMQSGLTSQFDAVVGSSPELSQLRTIEKKLARRMSEGVDRLGAIIKDMARAQRRLETRTSTLELKVFGSVNTCEK